jgi:hypothetical protein
LQPSINPAVPVGPEVQPTRPMIKSLFFQPIKTLDFWLGGKKGVL